jgi:isoaspartyl peptidase/L-asparaginase-like protein (Ntn-hydrolase superfamily)
MEKTIHTTLAGAGAEAFADREGIERAPLLTDAARVEWERWRADPRNIDRDRYRGWLPPLNKEEMTGVEGDPRDPASAEPYSHDTVSIIGRDAEGRLAACSSTSGMAFKTPGRVGDSPIIGHGLYCDQTAGAAVATGTGELISSVCGSFLIVERMRAGDEPARAIEYALRRIADRHDLARDHQVAFLAATPDGRWASGALRPGFHHTITDAEGSRVEEPTLILRTD